MSVWHQTARLVAISFITSLAAISVYYAYVVGPPAWQQRSLDRISKRIIFQEPFNVDLVRSALAQSRDLDNECRPVQLRAVAVLNLRLLELAIASGKRSELDSNFALLRSSVVRALSCAPADAFLWFALYWIDISQNGLSPSGLKYLEASYRFGTFEGWIQVKRNRYALAIFEQLPPALADKVVLEYATLLNSGFVTEAAANLAGPGLRIKERLLAASGSARMIYRRELQKGLRRAGVDATVPGVQIEARPWN